jgi:NAD(P)H dehydrogenase (quinone)
VAKVFIIYHSGTGNTAQLAEVVAEGVRRVEGASVAMHRIVGSEIIEGRFENPAVLAEMDAADAIIFGAPTYMGSISGQFKIFADATSDRWPEQRWANKLAAGFTVSANLSGDKLNALLDIGLLAAQQGMLWVNLDIPGGLDKEGRNRLGSQYGVMGQTAAEPMPETDLETGRYLGQRVALLAQQFIRGAK